MNETRTTRTNVLVIGAGGAGLRAAIAAHEARAEVIVVARRGRRDSHTVLAAGGINAALGTRDPEDSWQQHFADTVRESYGLAHPQVAEIMTREAPAAVLELADWGCEFARTEDGRLDQRYFGAHTYRRTCYSGDHTGRNLIYTLAARVESLGIPVIEHQYVSSLLIDDGACRGALAFDMHTGERTAFVADAVLLGTGGHTSLWQRNTSRQGENHGEGMALALRAGCRLMDMELVQFHPTGIVYPDDVAGTLVTEAVRGEGGRLYNAAGERFMERYDPERVELSTRDRVALANYTEIVEGRGGPHGGVFLDISHRGKDYIMEKLPRMYRQFLSFEGLDISKEPMEVAPTAHYSMGGISVEPETHATDVDGLFAAGECASGLHGANRLGGNSLVDILVFGRRAGEAAARRPRRKETPAPRAVIEQASQDLEARMHPGSQQVRSIQEELKRVMWEHCGVLRDEPGLLAGLDKLNDLVRRSGNVGIGQARDRWGDLAQAMDVSAALDVAGATMRCALERRETRGCHNRRDYPHLDPTLQMNLYTTRDGESGQYRIWSEPVPAMPAELAEWVERTPDLESEGRLLE